MSFFSSIISLLILYFINSYSINSLINILKYLFKFTFLKGVSELLVVLEFRSLNL